MDRGGFDLVFGYCEAKRFAQSPDIAADVGYSVTSRQLILRCATRYDGEELLAKFLSSNPFYVKAGVRCDPARQAVSVKFRSLNIN